MPPNPSHNPSSQLHDPNLTLNSLPGLGQVAQKNRSFTVCDEAEQTRRAGCAAHLRPEYYTSLFPEQREVYCPQGLSDAQLRDFMFSLEEEEELYAYETEMAEEETYSTAIAAEHGTECGGECCGKHLIEGEKAKREWRREEERRR